MLLVMTFCGERVSKCKIFVGFFFISLKGFEGEHLEGIFVYTSLLSFALIHVFLIACEV